MSRPTVLDRRHRRTRLQPALDRLEGRALLTTAGGLDPTFGNGTGAYQQVPPTGVATPSNLEFFNFVQVETDGSVLVEGPGAVIHLKADGTLDTAFGNGGGAPLTNQDEGFQEGLLVQPDGKILALAETDGTISLAQLQVFRFNADGSPDTTFGTGGELILPGTVSAIPFAAIQGDGKIDIVQDIPGPSSQVGSQLLVRRLNTDGTSDTSFGENGMLTISSSLPSQQADGIAIQPNGQIVISASSTLYSDITNTPPVLTPELFRLNPDGSQDNSISQAGILASGIVNPTNSVDTLASTSTTLIAQPDGKILVLGETAQKVPVLARINADGTLDKSLTSPGGLAEVSDMALQPNGDVVLTAGQSPTIGSPVNASVVRLTPGLTLDPTFGQGGVATVEIPEPTSLGGTPAGVSSYAVAVSPDNKIVVVGSTYFPVSSTQYSSTNAVVRLDATGSALPGDFTGDRIADPTIYLPSNSAFVVRPSQGGADQVSLFGLAGAGQTIPTPGDFTGSGQDDIAAYLPSLGEFAYRPPTGPDVLVPFGLAGSGQTLPAIGDYFGTGQDDIAAYLPSLGEFAIRNPAGGADEIIPFGIAGAGQSIPVPGDYDGSGKTELAVYLPSLGAFAYRPANGGADVITYFGLAGTGNTIPTPGDYTGSGKTEIAVYLPSLGEFVYRPANGGADVAVPFGIAGAGQTIPMPADYTGSGKTEIAAYFPSLGVFAYRPAGGGPDVVEPFGASGAGNTVPVTGASASVVPGSVSAMSFEVPSVVAMDLPSLISTASAKSTRTSKTYGREDAIENHRFEEI